MSFSIRTFALVTTALLASSTAACSRDAQPVAHRPAAVEFAGGTVRDAGDAARYEGCQAVVGDLRIIGSSLTDLSALRSVQSVSGKLSVTGNARLISLAGLKHVSHARSVEIRNNPMLAAYPGLLPSLSQVDESLVLRSNRGISASETRALLERVEVRQQAASRREDGSAPRLN